MSAKETNNEAVQTTTHYWGYREIDPSEFKFVGGGDDGGDGGDGDGGDGDGGDGDGGDGDGDGSNSASVNDPGDVEGFGFNTDTEATVTAGLVTDLLEGLVRGVTHIMNELNPQPANPPGQIPDSGRRADAGGYFGDGMYAGGWSGGGDSA
jgi:hypothetical protein